MIQISTCTSFQQRYNGHTRSARLETDKSRKSILYWRYPHTLVEIDKGLENIQWGTWFDLKLVFGVRWTKKYRKQIIDLFEWDETVLTSLQNNKSIGSIVDKKERMVSYLFETMLGLCIALSSNVSSNPSFECFNGKFK